VSGKQLQTLTGGISKWLTKDQGKIIGFINTIGTHLSKGFDNLSTFFDGAFDLLGDSIDRVRPTMETAISDLLSGCLFEYVLPPVVGVDILPPEDVLLLVFVSTFSLSKLAKLFLAFFALLDTLSIALELLFASLVKLEVVVHLAVVKYLLLLLVATHHQIKNQSLIIKLLQNLSASAPTLKIKAFTNFKTGVNTLIRP